MERTGPAYSSPKKPVGPDAVPGGNREADEGQPMRDHPRANYDRPVIHKPEEMQHPDEKEDGTRDDQVQLVAHPVIPTLSAQRRGWVARAFRLLQALVSFIYLSFSPVSAAFPIK